MALLAPISHGFLEDDGGAPGLYVTEAGVVVLRSVQGGPLVPVGGGGGATSPLVLTSTDASQVPLTLEADTGQTADLLTAKDENGVVATAITAGGDLTSVGTIHSESGFTAQKGYLAVAGVQGFGSAMRGDLPNGYFAPFAGQTANVLEVWSDGSPGPIFAVYPDGSVHIQTGTTVIADL